LAQAKALDDGIGGAAAGAAKCVAEGGLAAMLAG